MVGAVFTKTELHSIVEHTKWFIQMLNSKPQILRMNNAHTCVYNVKDSHDALFPAVEQIAGVVNGCFPNVPALLYALSRSSALLIFTA